MEPSTLDQERLHQSETPRKETAVDSSANLATPMLEKEKNIEEIVKSLEQKWEEKFEKQQAIMERLEAQLSHVTEFVASMFHFANMNREEESHSEKVEERTSAESLRHEMEKEEVDVFSEEELENTSPITDKVAKEKEKKPAWEVAIEKLADLTLEGFQKLGTQIEDVVMKVSVPIEPINEINIKSSKPMEKENVQASTSSQIDEVVQQEHTPKVIEPTFKPYVPPMPFLGHLRKRKEDEEYEKFLEVFKKLEVNIPLADVLDHSPQYKRFLKEVMSKKRKMNGRETVMLTQACTEALKDALPLKLNDPGKFTLDCTIGDSRFKNAFCDLGASINLIPFSVAKKLGLEDAIQKTEITIQFADRSLRRPKGVIEDVLLKVDKFIFPVDFVVLDIKEDPDIPIILGRPFMATAGAVIDVKNSKMVLRVGNRELHVNIMKRWRKSPQSTKSNITLDDSNRKNEEKKKNDEKGTNQFHPP